MRRFIAGLCAVVMASFILLAAAPAHAAIAPDPLDVADINHLDFVSTHRPDAWKTTIPSSLITEFKKPSIRTGTTGNPIPSKAAADAAMGGASSSYRQTQAGAKLAESRPAGVSVKDWLAQQKTPTQTAALASVKKNFAVPATRLAPLMKLGLGPAGTVVSAAGVGFGVGVEGSKMLGLNVEEGFCSPAYFDPLQMTAKAVGVDCANFNDIKAEYTKNVDAPAMLSQSAIGTQSCLPDGRCATIRNIYGTGAGAGYCLTFPTAYSSVPLVMSTHFSSTSWGGGGQYATAGVANLCAGSGSSQGVGSMSGYINSSFSLPVTNWRASSAVSAASSTGLPAPEKGDPDRTMKCTITITGGAQFSATAAQYKEGSGKIVPPHCPAVVQGVTESIKIETLSPGLPTKELYNEPSTPGYRTWATEFPECGSGLCTVDLFKQVGTDTKNCFAAGMAENCADWFTDPNKTQNYKCEYGGKAVALTECTHYADVFKIQQQATGAVYADPETGTSLTPNTSTKLDDGLNTGVMDPEKPRECFPTGWAVFNPLEWVLKPVGCALEDAFVPRPSVIQAQARNITAKWEASPPHRVITAVNTWDFDVTVSGCEGLPFTIDHWFPASWGFSVGTHAIAPACPGDLLGPVAPWSRVVLNIVITLASATAIVYLVSSVVNGRGVGE